MTRRRVAMLVLCLALAGCGEGTGGGASESWPAGRAFVSVAVTEHGQDRPFVAGTRIELRFLADGRFDARAGCNHLGGTGRIADGRLRVSDLATTEMACDPDRMDQDRWLGAFLAAGPRWTLVGDMLVLRGGEAEIQLTDREASDPDRPLAATRWVVGTIVTGEVASSVPAGVEAFIELDGTGRFAGSSGCADIGGRAEIRGDTIVFAIDGVAPPCPGEPGLLHRAVLAALAGAVGYRVEGASLTLSGPAGHGLVLRAAG